MCMMIFIALLEEFLSCGTHPSRHTSSGKHCCIHGPGSVNYRLHDLPQRILVYVGYTVTLSLRSFV